MARDRRRRDVENGGGDLSNPARRTNNGVTGAVKWLGSGLYVCDVWRARDAGQRFRAGHGVSRRYTYRCANSLDQEQQARHP